MDADGAAVLRHWQRCYAGCGYEPLGSGLRCPGLHQDLPVSRALYWYQLLAMQAMFPGQVLAINYHHLMRDPGQEVSRVLSFLNHTHSKAGSDAADAAEFLSRYDNHDNASFVDTGTFRDDVQRVEGIRADDMGWLQQSAAAGSKQAAAGGSLTSTGTVPMQQHEHSADFLREASRSLQRLQRLYARANSGLLHLLMSLGQAHALHSSTSVFPEPWSDLGLTQPVL